MEAIALLEEWVQSVGSQAGLTEQNTTIMSGAVGVPESRLELEIEVDSLTQLETFWGQIPPQAHKAWSQRAQHFLIDGSPKWEVFRKVAISSASEAGTSVTQPATLPGPKQSQTGLIMPDYIQAQEILSAEAVTEPKMLTEEEVSEDASLQEQNVMLDWKGDPMVVNPGDKLPFNFR
ncbi:hypothetical protein ABBQ38_002260 [Trebouxia sp. C0009 RCD-2024]